MCDAKISQQRKSVILSNGTIVKHIELGDKNIAIIQIIG